MYMLYRYLFLPKHCSESKWERLCLYGTKNYKEMSTEKRRRLHGMLQEGWEGLKIKHRHLSIVLKQATHWLCLMLLLLVSYQFDHKVFFGCLLSSYMVMPILHTLRSVWISKDSFLFFLFKIFLCFCLFKASRVLKNSGLQGRCLKDTLKLLTNLRSEIF